MTEGREKAIGEIVVLALLFVALYAAIAMGRKFTDGNINHECEANEECRKGSCGDKERK